MIPDPGARWDVAGATSWLYADSTLQTQDPNSKNFGQFGFRSQHPGGANFLSGDGSVRFLKESIAYRTFWGLGTKDGGETISASDWQ
jgi:prepilin-type processing-associated H-X9-DG protein